MKIKSTLVFLSLYFGIIFSTIAQVSADLPNAIPEGFHRTYAGKIGEKYSITMDLRLNGNRLIGSYRYVGKTDSIDLNGIIFPPGFYLGEFVNGKSTGKFSGKFEGDTISGEWSTPGGKKKKNFHVIKTADYELKPKKETLRDAVGTYVLESISGAVGANGMFDINKTKEGWKSSSSFISGGMREGQENTLSNTEIELLNSMHIKVDSALTVQFLAMDKQLLEIPFNETGMQYSLGEPRLSVLDEVIKKLSSSSTYVGRKLYLAALDQVDFSHSIAIEDLIMTGMLVLSYTSDDESFEMHIATSCCDNNILMFRKSN